MAHKKSHRTNTQTNLLTFRRKVLVTAIAACLSVDAWANPTGLQVISGQVGMVNQGSVLTVTNSANAILNWNRFSIGVGETTRFVQPNAASAVLNRVTGQDPSSILGTLQSNGRVFLINPNGILFGAGAQVNVAGLVASTLDMTNTDFLHGNLNFAATAAAGAVENQGSLTAAGGGSIYLVGTSVENSGLVRSAGGVYLAAGHEVRLVEGADPDIQVVVSAPTDKAVNLGQVVGGTAGIYGALVTSSGRVAADSAVATGGRVYLRATHGVTLAAGSSTTADGVNGGSVTVQGGSGDALVSGNVSAHGSRGVGGRVTVTGNRVGVMDAATVDASGAEGGGTVLVGGGAGGADPAVPDAQATYLGPNATVRADAQESGNGGQVVLWANDTTQVQGTLSARGGQQRGNGGQVETSGRTLSVTNAPDTSAPAGRGGHWLLDPEDITISASPDQSITSQTPFQPATSNTASTLNVNTLITALGTGSTVVVDTTGSGSGVGNIYLNAAINLPNAATALTLKANNSIFLNASIQGTPTQPFTLSLVPAQAGGTAGTVFVNANVGLGAQGSLAVTGSGHMQVSAGATPITLSAGGGITANTLVVSNGTLVADSPLTIATLNLSSGATLAGGGQVSVTSSFINNGGVINRSGAMNITQAVGDLNFSATGVGALTLTASAGDLNLGSISAGSSAVNLNAYNGAITQYGALLTSGRLDASAGDGIVLTNGANQISLLGNLSTVSGGIAVSSTTALTAAAASSVTAGGVLAALSTGETNVGVAITAPGLTLGDVTATNGAVLLHANGAALVAGNVTSGAVVGALGTWAMGTGIGLAGTGIQVQSLTANGGGAIVADAGSGSFLANGSLIATGTTSVPDTITGTGMINGVSIGIVAGAGITLNGGGNAGNGLIRLDADRNNNGTGIFTLNGALVTQSTSHVLDASGQKTGTPAIGIRAANVFLNAPLRVADGGDIYLLPSAGSSVGLGNASEQSFTLTNAELSQLAVTPTQTTQSQDGSRVWIGDNTTGAIIAEGAVFGDTSGNLVRVQLSGASIDSQGSDFGIQAYHLGLSSTGNIGAASADQRGLVINVHSLGITANGTITVADDSQDASLTNPITSALQVRNLVSNNGGNIDLLIEGNRDLILERRYTSQGFFSQGGQITLLVNNGSLTTAGDTFLHAGGGDLVLTANSMTLDGSIVAYGLSITGSVATMPTSATLDITNLSLNNSTLWLLGQGTLENGASLSLQNGSVLSIGNASSASATLTLQGSVYVTSGSIGVNHILNYGTLTKAGDNTVWLGSYSDANNYTNFANQPTGIVNVNLGTLALVGGDSVGTFNIVAGAVLDLNQQNNILDTASQINNAGTLSFSGGTNQVLGNYTGAGVIAVSNGMNTFDPISGGATLASLSVNYGTLVLTNDTTLNGVLNWNGGVITGAGVLYTTGTTNIGQYGAVYLQNKIWNNTGILNLRYGTIYLAGDGSVATTLNNQVGGQIVAGSTAANYQYASIFYTGTPTNQSFNNAGLVTVNNNTFTVGVGGTDTGTYAIGTGSDLQFSNATRAFNSGVALTGTNGGAGTFTLSGGTLNVNVAYTQSVGSPEWEMNYGATLNNAATLTMNGTFDLNGGTLNDAAGFTENGTFNWSSGTVTGAGALVTTGTTNVGYVDLLNKVWSNTGTLYLANGSIYLDGDGTVATGLQNQATGQIVVGTVANSGGTIGYYNTSTNKTFSNIGTVTINNGSLGVGVGGTDTGNYAIGTGGTLTLSNGTRTFGSGIAVTGTQTGAGTLLLSGGTLNLGVAYTQTATAPTWEVDGGTLNNTAPLLLQGTVNINGGMINDSAGLTLAGTVNWNNGTITGAGVLTTSGTTNIGTANNYYYGYVFLQDKTWNNTGIIHFANGTIYLSGDGTIATSLNNQSSGQIEVASTAQNGTPSAVVTYSGSAVNKTFNNAGAVTVNQGTLSIGVDGVDTGSYAIAAGSVFALDGGTRGFNSGIAVTGSNGGAGTFDFVGGTLNLNVAYTQSTGAPTWEIDGGTLNDTAGLTLNGAFNWYGGTVTGSGVLTTTGTTSTSYVSLQDKTWNNTGTINLGYGTITLAGDGTVATTLNNQIGGQIVNNNPYAYSSGIVYGNGIATNKTFNNAGTVTVNSGTLGIGVNGTDTGSYAIHAGAILDFYNGIRNFNAGVVIMGVQGGAGLFQVSGGTLNLNAPYTQAAGTPAWEIDYYATINNAATLTLNSALTLNSGTLNDSAGVTLNGIFNWNGGTIAGAGVLTTTATATTTVGQYDNVYLQNKTWNNAGTITITSGTIYLDGDGTTATAFNNNLGGQITLASASNGYQYSYITDSYTATNKSFNNAGVVTVRSGTASIGVSGTDTGNDVINAGGTLSFYNGTRVMSQGTLANAGTVSLAGGTNQLLGNYSGNGLLSVSGGTNTFTPASGGTELPNLSVSGGTLTLTGNTVIDNLSWSSGTLQNGGTLSVMALNVSGYDMLSNETLVLLGNGVMENSSLNMNNGAVFSVGDATHTGAMLTIGGNYSTYLGYGYGGQGIGHILNYGTIAKGGSGYAVVGGYSDPSDYVDFTNQTAGVVAVSAGNLQLSSLAAGINAGTLAISTGATLSIPNNVDNTGTVYGKGTLNLGADTLTNDGLLRAGDTETIGTLTITGNLVQGSGGKINIELGNAASNIYGQIAVSGTVTMAGTLNVTGVAPYTIAEGDVFSNVITAGGGISGTFGTVSVPTGIGTVNTTYTSNNLQLSLGSVVQCAADNCWTGSDGTASWNDPKNWFYNQLPSATDRVLIPSGATVTATGTVAIQDLWLVGNLTVESSGSFNVGTLFDVNAGTATVNGTAQTASLLLTGGTLAGGGAVTVTNTFGNTGGVINRTGRLSITQASGDLSFSATQVGALTLVAANGNLILGAIPVVGAFNAQVPNGTATLNDVISTNGGNLAITANAGITLNSSAQIQAGAGNVVLTVTGAGSLLSTAAGSVVAATGGVTYQADAMSLAGAVTATGATVNLWPNATNLSIYIEPTASYYGGGLTLSPTELQQISAGTVQIGRATDTGTLVLDTPLAVTDVGATTLGLAHQNVAINADIGTASTPFGSLVITAGNNITTGYLPNGIVANTLTLNPGVVSGSGQATLSTNATVGNLVLGGSGNLNLSGGATLTINNGLALSGAGTFLLSSGTLNLNVAYTQAVGTPTWEMDGGTLNDTAALTLNGTFNWNGGTITGAGVLTTNGITNVGNTNSCYYCGADYLQNKTWNNTGTLIITGRSIYLDGDGTIATSLNNQAGGQINVSNAAAAYQYSVVSYSNTNANKTFNNAGTVTINNGTWEINVDGVDRGTYAIGTGGTLQFNGGTRTFENGIALMGVGSGAGTFQVSGGTLNLNTPYTQLVGTPNWEVDYGTINDTAGLTLNGNFNWNGGTITGNGVLTTAGMTNIDNNGYYYYGNVSLLNKTWNNTGTITLSGGTIYLDGDGTVATSLNNQAGGQIAVIAPISGYQYAEIAYTNAGTNKTFNNAGTITVKSGTLGIGVDGTDTGTYAIGAGGILSITSGTRALSGGIAFTGVGDGAGTFRLAGGTLNLNTPYTQLAGTPTWEVDYGTINDTAGLTLNGNFNWNGGTITGNGVLTTNGTTTIMGSGYSYGYAYLQNKVWNNTGIINLTAGTIYLDGDGTVATSLNNQTGGQIVVNTPVNGYSYSFIAYSNATANKTFNNAGMVTVDGGTLVISVDGIDTGTYAIGANNALQMNSGTRTFNSGAVVTGLGGGAGTFQLAGGTLNLNTPYTQLVGTPTWELDGSVTLNDTAGLTLNDTFNWNSGTITGAGVLTTNGITNIGTGTYYYYYGNVTLQDKIWNNTGTINIPYGVALTLGGDGSVATALNNQTGGQIVVSIQTGYSYSSITYSNAAANKTFNNAGTVTVDNGTLSLNVDGTDAGTYAIGTGGTLQLSNGNRTFNGTIALTGANGGAGTFQVSGGTLNLNAPYTQSVGTPTWAVDGGTVNDTAGLTLNGAFNWNGGTITGNGVLTTAGTTTIDSGYYYYGAYLQNKTWNNTGTITLAGGSIYLDGDGTVATSLNNQLGGQLIVSIPTNGYSYSSITYSNAAANKTFNNAGTVTINNGTLSLGVDGTDTGTYAIGAGGTLQLNNGNRTFNGVIAVTGVGGGAGTFQVSGGTLNLNMPYTQLVGMPTWEVDGGTVNDTAGLTLNGIFNWNGGTITGNGVLTTAGTTNIDNNSYYYYYGGVHLQNKIWSNTGTINLTAGVIYLDGDGTVATGLNNQLGGQMVVNIPTNGYSYSSITYSNTTANKTFNNAGMVTLNNGTLSLGVDGTDTGTYAIGAGSTLQLSNGTRAFDGAVAVTGVGGGAGTFRVSGGTFNLNTPYTQLVGMPTWEVDGGVVNDTAGLTLNGTFNWNGGTITGNGVLTTAGTTNIDNNGYYYYYGNVYLQNKTWNNTGTITLVGGSIDLDGDGTVATSLNNQSGGQIVVSTPVNGYAYSSITYSNAAANKTFNNAGTVTINNGTLSLGVDGTDTGTYAVGAGSTLQLSSGNRTFNGALALTGVGGGAGTFQVSGGTLTLNTPYTQLVGAPTWEFDYGTINDTAGLTLNGTFNWNVGTITGNGVLTTAGTTNIDNNSYYYYYYGYYYVGAYLKNKTWNNSGTLNFVGGAVYLDGDGTVATRLNNQAGGQIVVSTPVNGYSYSAITYSTAAANKTFSNAGTVIVDGGTLAIGVDGTDTGTYAIGAGNTLQLSSGNRTFDGAIAVTGVGGGAGTFQVSGGTLNLNTPYTQLVGTPTWEVDYGTINDTAGLTLNGTFNWNGGTITGNGVLTTAGMTNIGNNYYTSVTLQDKVWSNTGVLTLAGGTIFLAGDGTATTSLTNQVGGQILASVGNYAGSANISYASTGANKIFNNAGTTIITGGTLGINVGGVDSGTYALGGGSTIHLSGGSRVFNQGIALTGMANSAGTLQLSDGTLTLNVAYVQPVGSVTWEVDGGTVNDTAGLTLNGIFNWNGGTITGNGVLTTTGTTNIDNNGYYYYYGSVYLQNKTWNNTGTITLAGGTIYLDGDGTVATSLNNQLGGQVVVSIPTNGYSSSITYSNVATNKTFNNAGMVTINNGILSLSVDGTDMGTYAIGTGNTLQLTNGNRTFDGAVAVTGVGSGAGTFQVSGGTLTLNTPYTQLVGAPTWEVDYGTVNDMAGLTLNGTFNWNGGTITGSGVLTTAGMTNIDNNGYYYYYGGVYLQNKTWNNTGTINLTSGAIYLDGDGTVATSLNNQSNGQIVVTALTNGYPYASITYANVTANKTFNNAGTVTVSGNVTLELGVDGTDIGSYMIAPGNVLDIFAGTRNFNQGIAITGTNAGAGTLQISGATINLNTAYIQPAQGMTWEMDSGTLNDAAGLTINGAFNWNGGIIIGAGAFNNAGTVTVDGGTANIGVGGTDTGSYIIAPGSVLQFSGGTRNLNQGFSLAGTSSGAGTLKLSGGTLNLNVAYTQPVGGVTWEMDNGAINDAVGLTINGTFNWDGGTISGAGAFNNAGTLVVNGGAALTNIGTFNNSGTVAVDNGTFDIAVSGTDTGSYIIGFGDVLDLASGVRNFNQGISIAGVSTSVGTLQIAGGTLNLNAAYTQPAGSVAWQMDGGTMNNTAGLTFNGAFNWNGGTITGSGVLSTLGTTNVNAATLLNAVWNNTGTINLAGGSITLDGNGTTATGLNNQAGGQVAVGTTINGGGTIGYANSATNKTFSNAGTVAVNHGTLAIDVDGTDTGSYTVSAGDVLNLAAGTRNFNQGISVAGTEGGAGTLQISNGTLNLNAAYTQPAGGVAWQMDGGTMNNTAGLTFNGTLNWNGGTITGSGVLSTAGTTNVGAATLLNAVWNNTGTINLAGGSITLDGNGTTATGLNNQAGGQVAVGTTINGGGTIGYANSATNKTFSNAGTVAVNNGTFAIDVDGTDTGSYTVGAGDVLNLAAGTRNFNQGISVAGTESGTGTLQISNGTLNLNVAYVQPAGSVAWQMDGGTMNNTAGLTFNGTFNWNGGTISGAGAFNNGGTMTVNGGAALTNVGTFNNTGTVMVNNGTLTIGVGGTDTGSYVVGAGNVLSLSGGTRNFNQGVSVAGTGTSAGTLQLSGGTLNLNVAYTQPVGGVVWEIDGGTVNNAAGLTFNDLFNWNAGILTGSGVLSTAGTTNVNAATLLNTVWNNTGTIDLAGGSITLDGNGTTATALNNQAGGQVAVGTTINGGGTIGYANSATNKTFSNAGTVAVNHGTLAIGVDGTDTGSYTVGAGNVLNLSGGTRNFNQGVSVAGTESGAGTLQLSGGTLNLNVAYTQPVGGVVWEMDGGTVNNVAGLTFNDLFNWNVGTLTGSGVLSTAGTTNVNAATLLNTIWNNTGTIDLAGGSITLDGNGTTATGLNNQVGGQVAVGTTTNSGGTIGYANSATNKTFSNAGTVAVNKGTLAIGVDGTDTGSYTVGAGNVLNLAGGTRNFNQGISAAGTESGVGTLMLSGGTLNLNVAYTQSTPALSWEVDGGTLNASGLTLLGGFLFTGGTVAMTGDFTGVQYNQTGGTLTAVNFTTNGSFTQTAGSLSLSGNANITRSSGNLSLSGLKAATAVLTASKGAILQTGALVANSLTTASTTGTTLDNSGNQIANFTATNSTSGDLVLDNTAVLTVAGIQQQGGSVTIDNHGALTVASAIVAANDISIDNVGAVVTMTDVAPLTAGGKVSIVAHSPITIGSNITATGNIGLVASSSTGGNDVLSVGQGVSVTTAGNVSLQAGSGISVAAGSNITSTGGAVSLQSGGSIVANGTLSAAVGKPTLSAPTVTGSAAPVSAAQSSTGQSAQQTLTTTLANAIQQLSPTPSQPVMTAPSPTTEPPADTMSQPAVDNGASVGGNTPAAPAPDNGTQGNTQQPPPATDNGTQTQPATDTGAQTTDNQGGTPGEAGSGASGSSQGDHKGDDKGKDKSKDNNNDAGTGQSQKKQDSSQKKYCN